MHTHSLPENILRHVWSEQYLTTNNLTTSENLPVKIFEWGTLNREAGPDFRNVVLEIDGIILRGEVEFHRTIEDWKKHSHENDTQYNSVILHVVLQKNVNNIKIQSQSGRIIPTIFLEPFLTTPLEKISEQLTRDEIQSHTNPIPCYQKNDTISGELIEEWLKILYHQREQEKVQRMQMRLYELIGEYQRLIAEPNTHYTFRQKENIDEIPVPTIAPKTSEIKKRIIWEQLLYESLMDGLGYSKNRKPFVKLAQKLTLFRLQSLSIQKEFSAIELQSIFFTISGLLPSLDEIEEPASKVRIHELRTLWNEIFSEKNISVEHLHSTEWIFAPTRPLNFPTLRMVVAIQLVQKLLYKDFFKNIIVVIENKKLSSEEMMHKIISLLEIEEDSFWNYHYRFGEASPRYHPLLGAGRKIDIIVNIIIPLCVLYADIFKKQTIKENIAKLTEEISLLENNSILKKMETQLLKGKLKLTKAFQQQGMLQLYKKYCFVERCGECLIGSKVMK